MDIRDEIITGSFLIGPDGRREPPNWKTYALSLEEKIERLRKKEAIEKKSEPPKLGEFFVFELKDGKMTQISIGLESIEAANSFIETMKMGAYYKSIRPDCVLIAMQVLNLV